MYFRLTQNDENDSAEGSEQNVRFENESDKKKFISNWRFKWRGDSYLSNLTINFNFKAAIFFVENQKKLIILNEFAKTKLIN